MVDMEKNEIPLRLPENLRQSLKLPLGKLIPNVSRAIEHIQKRNPTRLILIGDIVASKFLAAGLKPDIVVVDLMAMRSPVDIEVKNLVESFKGTVFHVKNHAGIITVELRKALEAAQMPIKIMVEGEEDLATIPAVLASPDGSIVVYGQPSEGIVLIEVTEEKRREFQEILNKFVAEV